MASIFITTCRIEKANWTKEIENNLFEQYGKMYPTKTVTGTREENETEFFYNLYAVTKKD